MMKWRPWPPITSKKFEAKLIVKSLKGVIENTDKLGVEINWIGSNKSNNRLSFKRRSVRRNVTKEGLVKGDGIVEWNEEFVSVCGFLGVKDGGFHRFDVAFKVFDVSPHPKNILFFGYFTLFMFFFLKFN